MTKELQRQMLLGIPVTNASLLDAVDAISDMVSQYQKDKRPRYVTTINNDLFADVWGWKISQPSNLELLRVLRNADLIMVEGRQLSFLCKCLSQPLKGPVSSQELFPKIIEKLQMHHSFFLLGGYNKVAWKTASALKKRNPHLKIAGILAPVIHTTGNLLVNAVEKDWLIVEAINVANPDILFVQLGNPKQEIWFDRIRTRLKVPVTIGLGHSLDEYAGYPSETPQWAHKLGLDWLFRAPKALWKHHFKGIFKSLYYSVPLVAYHQINQIMHLFRKKGWVEQDIKPNLLFFASHLTLSVIQLPKNLKSENSQIFHERVLESMDHNLIVFDFKQLEAMDLVGIYTLFNIWRQLAKNHKQFFGLFLSKDIRLLFKLHHVWDIFSGNMCEDPQEIINRTGMKELLVLFESIHQSDSHVTINFFGRLDNQHNYEQILTRLIPTLSGKNCIVDFSYSTEVDNAGFAFILRLKDHKKNFGQTFALKNVSRKLRQQFKLANLTSLL